MSARKEARCEGTMTVACSTMEHDLERQREMCYMLEGLRLSSEEARFMVLEELQIDDMKKFAQLKDDHVRELIMVLLSHKK